MKFGGKALSPAEIMEHFGPGERQIFSKVLGSHLGEAAEAAYFEYTRARLHEAPLFPGITPIIDECESRGFKTGIVTGRGKESTFSILKHHHLTERFGCILTHDDLSSSKPSPEGILKALELLKSKPSEALYLGDMWMDVRAAKRAGVKAASAGWDPVHDRGLVNAEGPDVYTQTPHEFLAYLRSFD